MELINKVAIVTGAAQGLGNAIGLALLELGCKVCVADINKDGEKAVLQMKEKYEGSVIFVECDVSTEQQFRDAFKTTIDTFGQVDILINNAGILDESNWVRMVNVNLIGIITGTKLALNFMGKNNGGGGGLVLNISSNAGLNGFPLAPVYSSTKHGILGLTKSYGSATHFEKTGVIVCAICPSAMETEMLTGFVQGSLYPDEAIELNKLLKPIEASAVAKAAIQVIQDRRNGAIMIINNDGFHYST